VKDEFQGTGVWSGIKMKREKKEDTGEVQDQSSPTPAASGSQKGAEPARAPKKTTKEDR
jgi:hypothetical protein